MAVAVAAVAAMGKATPGGARVLIVGGDGLIGSALRRGLPELGFDVAASSRRPGSTLALDLGNPGSWPDLGGFDAAVIVAALARLGDCDRAPEQSREINALAPKILAERLAGQGTYVVQISTDKVFDGSRPLRRREEPTCPNTVYGRHKAEAEDAVLKTGGAVLRLSKVLAPDLALLWGWATELVAGRAVQAFSDMWLAPVTVGFVVDLLARLLADRPLGIFHATGGEDRPYAELARRLAIALGAEPALVQAVATPPALAAVSHVPHSTLEMSRERVRYGLGNLAFAAVTEQVAAAVRSSIA